jgi:hypothetical protein
MPSSPCANPDVAATSPASRNIATPHTHRIASCSALHLSVPYWRSVVYQVNSSDVTLGRIRCGMVGVGIRRGSHARRLEATLWFIRACTGVSVSALIVLKDIGEYGLERDGAWGLVAPMSLRILFAGVLVSSPFVLLESFFARRNSHVWVQILCAIAGAASVGWIASLPVGLRFFGSREAVQQLDVEMTFSSFVLMGVSYVLLVVICRRRRMTTPIRADSGYVGTKRQEDRKRPQR